MFKLLLLAGVVAVAHGVPSYGAGYGLAGGYSLGGYGAGVGLGAGYGLGAGLTGLSGIGGLGLAGGLVAAPAVAVAAAPAVAIGGAAVQAPVLSRQSIQVYDVPSTGAIAPTYVDIPANSAPIFMTFRSRSSRLVPQQYHEGQAGSYQESASQDEPHLLRHTVTKPVMQEVREIVTPFRRITQEVQPVREEVQTLVARNAGGLVAGAGAGAGAALVAAAPAAGIATGGAIIGTGLASGIATGGAIIGGPALAGAGFGTAGYGPAAGYGIAGGYGLGLAGGYGGKLAKY